MKNLICCLAALLAAVLPGAAQEKVDKLFFDMRTSFHQEVTEGVYTGQLVGEYLNFHILGHLSPTVNYRVRQRLNKKVFDERNMFNATDMMYINWQATERWSFLFGKHAVLIGGYEYDAVPIDVYFYSKFCNNLYQGFTFGASATYKMAENQNLVGQICNSPLSLGFQNIYAYNLAWCGQFTPWWKTIWSVNFVEDSRKQMINYIALGNHIQSGDILFDLDLMNRAGFGQQRFFLGDISVISKFIWSVGAWNICAKAGYERNDAANVDGNGIPYDLTVAPGTRYTYAGAGVEYFPLGNRDIRIHAVGWWNSGTNAFVFNAGVTFRLYIVR
jgi:hypothetical protein